MGRKLIGTSGLLLAGIVLVMSFQNCSHHVEYSGSSPQSKSSFDNGQPYSGKPGVYRRFDTGQPCSDLDLNGKPLPNDEILITQDSQGKVSGLLARQLCVDVAPVVIADTDLKAVPNSPDELIYKGQSFSTLNPPSPFDLVTPACPGGLVPKSSPLLSNIFVSPLDWSGQPNPNLFAPGKWIIYPGIGVGLAGTIASLPAYSIQRNDSNNLSSFNRASQQVTLQTNVPYVFTFLAQPGTVNAADWWYYRQLGATDTSPQNETSNITFDFQNLTAKVNYAFNISNVSATIRPFGNGFLCTVYFTSGTTTSSATTDIGIAPSVSAVGANGKLGDSVLTTAAELLPVNQICQ